MIGGMATLTITGTRVAVTRSGQENTGAASAMLDQARFLQNVSKTILARCFFSLIKAKQRESSIVKVYARSDESPVSVSANQPNLGAP